ncbi:MAG: hypothetical protein FWE36_03655 [Erysipelotrichales bacterium]|nr:hypothetical protein [Erysipelotrichales bacterium]
MLITANTKVYIFCPAHAQSGGPEALHQLRFYLEACNLESYLVYYNKENNNLTPARYEIYNPKVLELEDIIDNHENIMIVPESNTRLLLGYQNLQKAIWWLGISANDIFMFKKNFKNLIKKFIRKRLSKKYVNNVYNLCGSKFAYQFLEKKKIKNIHYLVEPISRDFLLDSSEICLKASNRVDTVLYNPSKPSETLTKLLKSERIKFIPLRGYTPQGLAELFRSSKLYIDFGEFGGPERLPKETVFFGMMILVGKQNAATNDFDVAIPEKYKLSGFNDIENIEKQILELLRNYEDAVNDFASFRQKIMMLEANFIQQIKEIFLKN